MAGMTAGYAAALYELASERGMLAEFLRQAAAIRDLLQGKRERAAIEHPRKSGAEKRSFLQTVLPADTHADLIGFFHMLIAERQEGQIVPALEEFVARGTRQDEKMRAYVVSAAELKPDQAAALERVLYNKLGRHVELSVDVDPSLIGGFRLYVNGLAIDRSVKKELGDLRDAIKRGGAV